MTSPPNPQPPPPGPSPGNAFSPNPTTPPMRLPSLSFIYRLECTISPTEIHVGAPHNGTSIRSIAPITGGSAHGPRIHAEVLSVGAADWAVAHRGTHSMRLEARYLLRTIETDTDADGRGGWNILVNSNGLYRPGPGTEYAKLVEEAAREGKAAEEVKPPETVTQDDVEFFTHVTFEADGQGPYNWLNGLVCVGVLTCVEGTRIVLDCYALTNFGGREVEGVVVR